MFWRSCAICSRSVLEKNLGAIAHIPIRQSSNQYRWLSQAQRRLPSRMTLSRKVGKPGQSRSSDEPARRGRRGPFGGTNLKEARIRNVPERPSAVPESKPAGRGRRTEIKPRREGYKALKMQRALAQVPYGHRSSIKQRISQVDSFKDFPLLPSIQGSISTQALNGLEHIVPTPVQRLAIPALLRKSGASARGGSAETREDFLIAAETGSGKTLAYLLPMIDAVKRAEAVDVDIDAFEKGKKEIELRNDSLEPMPPIPHPTTGRPRAIVLLPSSELVAQVGALTKSLSHTVKFRSALISSAFSSKVIRNRLFSPHGLDILISTPHLLASIADSNPNILSQVTHLVVDEADSLLDRGFSPLTSAIIDRATPSLKQLVLCSATIPRSLDAYLRRRFPDIRRLVTPNLHAIPRRVQLGVVDVENDLYHGNKNLACADTIWSIARAAADHDGPDKSLTNVKYILVFVNEREKTQEVADYLVSKGIDAVALSRDTPDQRQSEILAEFTAAGNHVIQRPSLPEPETNQANSVPRGRQKRSLPNTKVLVTTDLGSRGIDTVAVRHVILYSMPHSTIDFIHRLGRTGRMGRRGRGIVLVGKHDRRDIVSEVREGMFKGQALI